MASAEANDFLTKQIRIQKETVTFRWLSRALSVHVNEAKNQLASFYASSLATDEPVHATYLLVGDVAPLKTIESNEPDDNDVEMEGTEKSETICTRKIVLVGENDLETAKAQFIRSPSVHIYSLSPAVIKDVALLAIIADRVRPDDVSKGTTFNKLIGMVVGSNVKLGYTRKSAATQAGTNTTVSTSTLKSNPPAKKAVEKPKASEITTTTAKGKQDEKKKGTLNWSKAPNRKVEKETTTGKSKIESKNDTSEAKARVGAAPSKFGSKKDEAIDKPTRGTKRSSMDMSFSDSEANSPPPKTQKRTLVSPASSRPASRASAVKVKRNVMLSDDEDSGGEVQKTKNKLPRQKGKGRVVISDDEDEVDPSLKAMMDLDDSEVTLNKRSVKEEEEDIEMASDSEPMSVRPKRKRKPKKVIPVGSNGLPKRRVVKTRKSKNAKGYTVTEDYSSYESVSESEQPAAATGLEKNSKKERKSKKDEGVTSVSTSDKPALKRKPSAKGKDKKDDNISKTQSGTEEVLTDTISEQKKLGSTSNAESATFTPAAKVKNSGKGSLMNYFAKK